MTKYCSENLTFRIKNAEKKRDICRTYCSGNEKKKIKSAKQTEIKRVRGAIKKFNVKKE